MRVRKTRFENDVHSMTGYNPSRPHCKLTHFVGVVMAPVCIQLLGCIRVKLDRSLSLNLVMNVESNVLVFCFLRRQSNDFLSFASATYDAGLTPPTPTASKRRAGPASDETSKNDEREAAVLCCDDRPLLVSFTLLILCVASSSRSISTMEEASAVSLPELTAQGEKL
jgi:hypothetical protein